MTTSMLPDRFHDGTPDCPCWRCMATIAERRVMVEVAVALEEAVAEDLRCIAKMIGVHPDALIQRGVEYILALRERETGDPT